MASPAPAKAETELTIAVKASAQAPAKTWKLTCGPTGGDHPDAAAACAKLDKVTVKDPFKPVPKTQMCTMIFGGPEEATVTGTWKGKQVNAKFHRKNGCEMSRWNQLGPLFGPVPPAR